MTLDEMLLKLKNRISRNSGIVFISTFVVGMLTHMAILTSDVPNHDGLSSMYFDQNMITSGRWFLMIAAGISSFYSLPWLIGLLSIIYLSITAVLIVKIFDIKSTVASVLTGAVIVTFPVLTSNFAYVFTMDGYMLGLLLCVLSVLVCKGGENTKLFKWTPFIGGVILGTGMGVYQAYLSVTMLICVFLVASILVNEGTAKEKFKGILRYIHMGVTGVAFYYIMLRLLLLIQGKQLSNYQGISGMAEGNQTSIMETIKLMYSDFIKFSLMGKVLVPNAFVAVAAVVLLLTAAVLFVIKAAKNGLFKKPLFYIFTLLILAVIPCVTDAILVISKDVTYHVLMRYQWIIFVVMLISIVDCNTWEAKERLGTVLSLLMAVSIAVISFSYIVTDNIAYSNLIKRYEKTYAYCIRLADRIEQTEGYYQGMPVAMVGVVGNDNFPTTDITTDVTGSLIGTGGDFLLYKGENYRDFFKYYLGTTINVLDEDHVIDFYYSDVYANMASFPDAGSTYVSDGILYVKTENVR